MSNIHIEEQEKKNSSKENVVVARNPQARSVLNVGDGFVGIVRTWLDTVWDAERSSMKFLVIKQEIHSQRIMIEAESRMDAKTRVLGGEGTNDGPLVYKHNYNSHKWAITLLHPPKEEM